MDIRITTRIFYKGGGQEKKRSIVNIVKKVEMRREENIR
jgi:hypothetical protein